MRRACSVVLLCAMFLNGCAHWATVADPLDVALRPDAGPHHVRLVLRDSSHVELRFAEANPDAVPPAVTGRRDYPVREFIVVPRDSIVGFEVLRSTPDLVGLVAVVGVVAVLGALGSSLWRAVEGGAIRGLGGR